MRLRSTVIVAIIIPLFASLFAFSAFSLWALENSSRERLQNEVKLIARAIRTPISYAMEKDREGSIQESLSSAFSFQRIYGAYVYDNQGERLAGIGMGGDAMAQKQIESVARTGDEKSQYISNQETDYYAYFIPLTNWQGKVTGVLQVNRLESTLSHYINLLTLIALLIFVGGIVWVLLLVWWGFRRYVDMPLKQLHISMQRIEEGDMSHRAIPSGSLEFSQLARGFNNMIDAIVAKDAEVLERKTKEIELERHLRKSRKLAEIGVLAAGVAHELGSPLTVIKGQSRRMQRHANTEHDIKSLQRIDNEIARMTRTIEDLINLGRKHTLHKKTAPIMDLVEDSLLLIESETQSQKANVDVVSSSYDLSVNVDPDRFQQVLTNLFKNAVQAANDGDVIIRVGLDTSYVLIEVEDSGPGIDEDEKPYLFDPFFTTKPVNQGSGLGLSVAHRIVEDHGGDIQVAHSTLGGAKFSVRIPMAMTEPQGAK
ncbi:HAMP domain-containing histidine kinase [Chromohalobacter canadensis]|uniref:sensor histidine kinase n=1 Tax=Chromohalobacter canadensis TaxID=141389 RepID=UPI0021C24A83|nr:HAMP domain-containing sensor histidine kinase [Chromohalobacter canadensis]MCT8468663.1 HAMP domain-containing histidine kinase [Chromohalobacter canadensis]MCT8471718.1 HAMP domain-containing histidine kinase [Chromohalobacter canadensis]MCT8499171.1 HAMP domain-containing histidine kinase [Chromohalobacter canadensis]